MKASFDKGFVDSQAAKGRSALVAKIHARAGVYTLQYGIPEQYSEQFVLFTTLLHQGKEPRAAFDEAFSIRDTAQGS